MSTRFATAILLGIASTAALVGCAADTTPTPAPTVTVTASPTPLAVQPRVLRVESDCSRILVTLDREPASPTDVWVSGAVGHSLAHRPTVLAIEPAGRPGQLVTLQVGSTRIDLPGLGCAGGE